MKPRNIWLWLKDAYHIAVLIDWRRHRLISSYFSWVLRAIRPPLPWSSSFFPSHYHSCSDAYISGWANGGCRGQSLPLGPLRSGASTFLCLSPPRPHTLSLRFLFSFPPTEVLSCFCPWPPSSWASFSSKPSGLTLQPQSPLSLRHSQWSPDCQLSQPPSSWELSMWCTVKWDNSWKPQTRFSWPSWDPLLGSSRLWG